jgi:hypothetical protein
MDRWVRHGGIRSGCDCAEDRECRVFSPSPLDVSPAPATEVSGRARVAPQAGLLAVGLRSADGATHVQAEK